jgi:hypothetical protein
MPLGSNEMEAGQMTKQHKYPKKTLDAIDKKMSYLKAEMESLEAVIEAIR